MATTAAWKARKSVADHYDILQGNAFGAINSDVAGKRNDELLPIGTKDIQLYSLATPNGQKIGIFLEEADLDYDAHFIDIRKGEQFSKGFVQVNPNSKIPCIVDLNPRTLSKDGDRTKKKDPVRVFESGSILLYLSEKTSKFCPEQERTEIMNWLFFAHGGIGPIFGNFGHFFTYAPSHLLEARNYGVARYGMEVRRLLSVIDQQLQGHDYIVGNSLTIADMATFPWIVTLEKGYKANEFLNIQSYKNIDSYMKRMWSRPGVVRGMKVTSSPQKSKSKL